MITPTFIVLSKLQIVQKSQKQTATTSRVMAVWYLSEIPAGGQLLPQGLHTLHLLTCRRIEGSSLNLLFLPFALVDIAEEDHRD